MELVFEEKKRPDYTKWLLFDEKMSKKQKRKMMERDGKHEKWKTRWLKNSHTKLCSVKFLWECEINGRPFAYSQFASIQVCMDWMSRSVNAKIWSDSISSRGNREWRVKPNARGKRIAFVQNKNGQTAAAPRAHTAIKSATTIANINEA